MNTPGRNSRPHTSVDDRMEKGDAGTECSAADEGRGSKGAAVAAGEYTGAQGDQGAQEKNDGGALAEQG